MKELNSPANEEDPNLTVNTLREINAHVQGEIVKLKDEKETLSKGKKVFSWSFLRVYSEYQNFERMKVLVARDKLILQQQLVRSHISSLFFKVEGKNPTRVGNSS